MYKKVQNSTYFNKKLIYGLTESNKLQHVVTTMVFITEQKYQIITFVFPKFVKCILEFCRSSDPIFETLLSKNLYDHKIKFFSRLEKSED